MPHFFCKIKVDESNGFITCKELAVEILRLFNIQFAPKTINYYRKFFGILIK